jgi:hypothetical protein
MALLLLESRPTQNNALIYQHIIPDLCRLADDYSHAVVNEEATAYFRSRMNFDPC